MWDPTASGNTGNHPATSQNIRNVNIHGGNFSATVHAPERRARDPLTIPQKDLRSQRLHPNDPQWASHPHRMGPPQTAFSGDTRDLASSTLQTPLPGDPLATASQTTMFEGNHSTTSTSTRNGANLLTDGALEVHTDAIQVFGGTGEANVHGGLFIASPQVVINYICNGAEDRHNSVVPSRSEHFHQFYSHIQTLLDSIKSPYNFRQIVQMSALSPVDLRGQGADERTIQIIEKNKPMLQEILQEQWTPAEEARNDALTNIGQGAIQYGTTGRRKIQLGMGPTPPLGQWPQDTRQRDQIDLALAIRQCQARLQHLLMLQSQPGQQLQPQELPGVDMMLGHLGGSQMLQQMAPVQPQPAENAMKRVTSTKNRLRELTRQFKNKYLKLSKKRLTGQEPALPCMSAKPEKETGSTTGSHSLASTFGDGNIGAYGGSFIEQSQENNPTQKETESHKPASGSIFRDVGRNIYGGTFTIQVQENIHKTFAHHIIPEAFHDADAGFALPKCYPGTRKAIMQDLIHWFEQDSRTYPIYHLYAPVGSGKTAIAKTLADNLSNYDDLSRNSVLATFFFSRTTESRSNAQAFIATIAYQVAKNLPPVAAYIMEAAISDPAIFEKDIFVQMHTLLLNPLRIACTVERERGQTTSHWPRLFVIDGLDECHSTQTQINILGVIAELALYRPLSLAIFLSCRPVLHIRITFADPHLSRLALKISLSNEYESDSDIRTFLELKFREIRNTHCVTTGIILPSCWPGPEIIDILVRRSSGHFIYPSIVVNYVGALDDNPSDRLKVICGLLGHKVAAEERPFRRLDALYSQVLASIQPNSLPTILNAFSFALVGSMLLDVPKTTVPLAGIEGVLLSVLSHRRKGGRAELEVSFLQISFRDFLLDPARSGRYHIDLKGAHASVAIYLLQNYIEDNTGRESSARAIYSLIGHLRMAAPTEALLHKLQLMGEVTTFTKIFKNCNRPDDLGSWFDVWKVLQSLGTCLGQLVFRDASMMGKNFLKAMTIHLHKELEKYAKEPLDQLIALLMCGACFPQDVLNQRSPVNEALVSLIWQKFNFLDIYPADEASLRLLVSLKADQPCLRKLVTESGYTVDPSVYTTACINALQCLKNISGGSSPLLTGHGNGRDVNLSSEFASFRQAAETALQNQEEDIPLASLFTHFFTEFIVRLLEHAKPPSKAITDYLYVMEDDIKFLCRCADRVNIHGVRQGKRARAAVHSHMHQTHPYSSHVSMAPTLYDKLTHCPLEGLD